MTASAAKRLEAVSPITLVVREVRLVSQQRIDHLYRWEQIATIPLGG